MSKQNIVVVGGGGAGVAVARGLAPKLDSSKYNLILITAGDYHLHRVAAIRVVVTDEGNLEQTAFIPYDSVFNKGTGTLKVGTIASIQKNADSAGGRVVLTDGEVVLFSILVLAPGSTWEGPLDIPPKRSDALAFINDWRAKFKKAQSYLLVGGGAVGLELAGELREFYPDKKVTLVHAAPLLLNDTYANKFRLRLEREWQANGVELILDDRIDEIPEGPATVTTAKGKTITADLILPTRGPKPNTEIIRSLGDDVVNASGFVKVLGTLQLEKHPDIYAAGDVIEWSEQKQLAKTTAHAGVVVANILAGLGGKPAPKAYKSAFEAILVTNGKIKGVGYFGILWGIVIGNWLSSLLKSKGLLISYQRKNLGLPS